MEVERKQINWPEKPETMKYTHVVLLNSRTGKRLAGYEINEDGTATDLETGEAVEVTLGPLTLD